MLDYLRKLAQKHKIDLIGIADLTLLKAQSAHFENLKSGDIAFFKGDPKSKIDCKSAFDGAKGIIAFALSYKQIIAEPEDMSGRGKISMIAYGEDYHAVMLKRAEALMSEFCDQYKCNYKICCDTGKLSDRMAAYSAGLGFIGKNRFLINEEYGSFIVLGHILLDIELEHKAKPIENKCGGCTRCIDSCPNHAICAGFLDYQKCISYITQTTASGEIHGYLYGCDICQLACPYNQKTPETTHAEFIGRCGEAYAYPYIADIANMSAEAFDKIYQKSSLAWKGLKNLQLNARNLAESD